MCSCRGNKLFKSSTLLRTNVGTCCFIFFPVNSNTAFVCLLVFYVLALIVIRILSVFSNICCANGNIQTVSIKQSANILFQSFHRMRYLMAFWWRVVLKNICMYPHISFCNPHSWLLTWSHISLSFLLRLLSPKTCRLTPLSQVEPSGRRREDERATEGRVVLQWGTAASLSLRRSGTATVGWGDESGADSGEQREWRDEGGPGVHGGETRTGGAVQKMYICISMEFDPIWPKKILDTWWKVGFLFIIRLLQVFS